MWQLSLASGRVPSADHSEVCGWVNNRRREQKSYWCLRRGHRHIQFVGTQPKLPPILPQCRWMDGTRGHGGEQALIGSACQVIGGIDAVDRFGRVTCVPFHDMSAAAGLRATIFQPLCTLREVLLTERNEYGAGSMSVKPFAVSTSCSCPARAMLTPGCHSERLWLN